MDSIVTNQETCGSLFETKYVYVILTHEDRQHSVADKIPHFFPCKTMIPLLVRRKWVVDGFKEITIPLMSGYIFLFSNEQMNPTVIHRLSGVQKVLDYGDKAFALTGFDEQLARWLARHNGIIGLSKAIQVDGRLQVIEGPLKDDICKIMKVDKHKRYAKIELQFHGTSFTVWMHFDWAECCERLLR